jgi:hypothetical protein
MLFGSVSGYQNITNLKGTKENPILITSGNEGNFVIEGAIGGIQFSNIENVIIQKLTFQNITGNGLNIDDGGTLDTPSINIIIENCIWMNLNSTGNLDELKMSGVDNFVIRNCRFANGAINGSLIDMVGCHNGIIEYSKFSDGGSNCIQVKGGCKDITIRRNEFIRCGERGINIGGSTGMQFFRPQDAHYEASNVLVNSNIFWGGTTPFAFVGALNSSVINNTVINPNKWCMRILQENNDPQLDKCSGNTVNNNIFYFADKASKPVINIGPETKPETFIFNNNLWYNYEVPTFSAVNVPVNEPGRIIQNDPLFSSVIDSNLTPTKNSPAIGNGISDLSVKQDFYGIEFTEPFTIGAIFVKQTSDIIDNLIENEINIFPNPSSEFVKIKSNFKEISEIQIFSANGKMMSEIKNINNDFYNIDCRDLNSGIYFIKIKFVDSTTRIFPFIHKN